jgi:CheY-like chemotaxis protein
MAISGGEAFSLLQAGGDLIELVITDIRMPRMSGEEFAKRMAHLSSPPPLLYVSGAIHREEQNQPISSRNPLRDRHFFEPWKWCSATKKSKWCYD